MKKTLFSLAIFCFIASSLLAQKKIKGEAHIGYEITDVKSDDMMASMIKGSKMDLYITKENSHSNMNMMSGMMVVRAYTLEGSKDPITLMEMMGNKIKIVSKAEDNEKEKAKAKTPEFKSNKEVTKVIEGYKCYESKASMADGSVITLFVTDKIDVQIGKGMNVMGVYLDSVEGFPLEIGFSNKEGGMTLTAKKVESKVDNSVFEYNDKGFKEMTPEELQKMGMGMGF